VPVADEHTHYGDEAAGSSVERVVFFSDAVMAIAITLLAIDLRLPSSELASDADFLNQLSALAPRYFAFVVSFFVIGAYWLVHHRWFRYVVRIDGTLLLVNLLFLFFVVQLPFLNSMLGEHGDLGLPTALYALGLALMGFASTLLWVVAYRHALVSDAMTPHAARYLALRGLVSPFIFLVSIPIAFVSPTVAEIAWVFVSIGPSLVIKRIPRLARAERQWR
jgi:uncharacterized membrane protein